MQFTQILQEAYYNLRKYEENGLRVKEEGQGQDREKEEHKPLETKQRKTGHGLPKLRPLQNRAEIMAFEQFCCQFDYVWYTPRLLDPKLDIFAGREIYILSNRLAEKKTKQILRHCVKLWWIMMAYPLNTIERSWEVWERHRMSQDTTWWSEATHHLWNGPKCVLQRQR